MVPNYAEMPHEMMMSLSDNIDVTCLLTRSLTMHFLICLCKHMRLYVFFYIYLSHIGLYKKSSMVRVKVLLDLYTFYNLNLLNTEFH